MDELLVLILVLFLIAVLLTAVVLPIVALVISSGIRKRLSEIQARIDRIEKTLAEYSIFPSAVRPEPEARPASPPEPEPVTPPPPTVAPEPPPPPAPALNAYQLESIIGRRWVGWIAVLLILFATAFFLKYAFDNRWIGELGRVSIGITFGIIMCLGGFRYRQRGWRIFSQILTAGGVVLLYLSTYAAFGYYHLVGQKTAFAYLAILIAEAAAISLVYNAPAIAIMALIGGLLTPILLHSDRNQYRSFFMYLFVLDAGALALLKHWRGLSSIAYFGTQLLFWLWYNEHYHHQLRTPVLIFQTAIFLLFLLAHLVRELIRREQATLEDAMLLLVNPFSFFATAYNLLNPTHHDWMGAFAIGMALVYASAAKFLLTRAKKSRREILLLIAVALTFVTIAIPIQLRSNWITIAWAVEGLAILWAALEIRSVRLRAHAFALFGLAFGKFIFWDTPYGRRPTFTPVFNRYFLSSLFVIGCFLAAVYLYHRADQRKLIDGRVTKIVLGLCAALAFWLLNSIETHTFFVASALAQKTAEDAEHQRWLGQMALSVLWAGYAAALAALGFVRRIASVRWAALALFAVTVVKALLVDIAQLQKIYRIIVFFVLGILLLLVAWGYHRAFHSRESIT
ncbi:MAG TPA: DUF2339 domain-containing protein [Pyrinomonadaceae bacterium]|jgi:uncharacterized membrane protein|nr:DUF2339 domain-containing protein [Pyrinomonadaceae bacterium]